jgi:hypothetical protein
MFIAIRSITLQIFRNKFDEFKFDKHRHSPCIDIASPVVYTHPARHRETEFLSVKNKVSISEQVYLLVYYFYYSS